MRLLLKVLLTLLFVALLPVVVSGVSGVVLSRTAVGTAVRRELQGEARHLAEISEEKLLGSLDDLRQASQLGLAGLSPQERTGALWIIYRGDAARTAVALIDGRTGESVNDPVFRSSDDVAGADASLAAHDVVAPDALARFAEHIPLAEALSAGKALGVPYADPARGEPLIALAVRVPGPVVDGKETPWVVAVELALRTLNMRFEEAADEGLQAMLVDLDGKVVCHTQRVRAIGRADVAANAGVQSLFDARSGASGVVDDAADASRIIAYARATRLAGPSGRTWGVVVERDRASAMAPVSQLQRRVGFWIAVAVLLALVAGALLAFGITRPLEVLASIVGRYTSGDADRSRLRAPALGADEIGRLAVRFNAMADAIDDRDRQLRAFNDELQKKVDERTRELRDTQQQLIQSQKLAAVGQLGAGVAHEINNPLAGVLGSAQLALLRFPEDGKPDPRIKQHLADIEREALRIRDIVESLLKVSQDPTQQTMARVDLNQVIDGALALVARPLIQQRVIVKKEFADKLPPLRGRAGELHQAVLHLLHNARDAMPDGGTLTLRTELVDGRIVRLTVTDTGPGIPELHRDRVFEPFFTTRASKGHKGMGLSIVHRIVEEHQGRVVVDSGPGGKGATLRVTLPIAQEASLV